MRKIYDNCSHVVIWLFLLNFYAQQYFFFGRNKTSHKTEIWSKKSSFIFSRGKCNVKKFSTILTIFIAPLRKVGEWETVRGYKDEKERVSECVVCVCVCESVREREQNWCEVLFLNRIKCSAIYLPPGVHLSLPSHIPTLSLSHI